MNAETIPTGDPGNRPRIGVGIVIERNGQVLLVKRRNVHGHGTWSTPGGHLEYGETPRACAAREALEETGVTVRDIRFRAITNDLFERDRKHYVTIWMQGVYHEGDARPRAAYELSEVRWFSWDDLPAPLFPPLRRLVDGACDPAPS